MNISREGVEITTRFFQALDMLRQEKRLRGVQAFANNHGFSTWHLQMLKSEKESRVLKPEYITTLCREYGISLEWIMFGNGKTFV